MRTLGIVLTIKALLLLEAVLLINQLSAQEPTYTVNETFYSGDLFRAATGITDFHYLEDGRILVGGSFMAENVSGFGMIFSSGEWDDSASFGNFPTNCSEIIVQEDGYVYPSIYGFNKILLDGTPWSIANGDFWSDLFAGGTFNPYIVERVYDIHQMENGDLLLAGAITTDTLQLGIFRGLARLTADGTHDTSLPAIDITPNNGGGAIRRIFPAPDGGWYVSGGFTALNGHQTNHVAKLTEDFTVDTDFVSPFMYDGPVPYQEDIILVDDQSRVWVSGYQMRLLENPNDSIQIIRLLPDGSVDFSFIPRLLENTYPSDWAPAPCIAVNAQELENHSGHYMIYGSFSHFEEVNQPCITVVDDTGTIQDNYFQSEGATINFFNDNDVPFHPRVNVVDQLENGDLLIGGAFSEFMGEERYSLVRLNQGFLSTENERGRGKVLLRPNPADEFVEFEYDLLLPSKGNSVLRICDIQGRPIGDFVLGAEPQGMKTIATSDFPNGFYVYEFMQDGERVISGKLVIQH